MTVLQYFFELSFILEIILQNYYYKNYYRQNLDKLLRELLIADKVGHRLVKPLLERFCEIHSDSEQRINSLVEIISDIRQPINEQSTQTPRSKEKQRHLEVKVSN